MTTSESRAAEVLTKHALRPTDPACACGWDWDCREVILPSAVDFDSSRYRLSDVVRPEQHHAHVAAALSAAGCLRDDRESETVTCTTCETGRWCGAGDCSQWTNHPDPDGGDL